MNIMRTALSLGGGTADASSSTEPTASADESSSGDGDDEERLDLWIAKQRLEKIENDQCCRNPKDLCRASSPTDSATFPGRVDHGTLTERYSVFINPAFGSSLYDDGRGFMGKFAIIPLHPSNTFFLQFPNCLAYRTKLELPISDGP
jgi:hypothetical protein